MPLHLGDSTVQIALPVLDIKLLQINWYWDLHPLLLQDESGATDLFNLINEYAGLVAWNPVWNLLTNDSKATTFNIGSGEQQFNGNNILQAVIQITAVDPDIDRNWLPSDYATYGWLEQENALGQLHQEYITAVNQVFDLPVHPPTTAIRVQLFGATQGRITLYPWLGVPPIQYNVNEGTWVTYSIGGPWYGPSSLPFPKPNPG